MTTWAEVADEVNGYVDVGYVVNGYIIELPWSVSTEGSPTWVVASEAGPSWTEQ